MQELQNPPRPKMHVFVCINDRSAKSNNAASCGPTITAETVRDVKRWIIQTGLMHEVLITKTYCLGICPAEGGIVLVYPNGKWFTKVHGAKDIISIIKSELNNS